MISRFVISGALVTLFAQGATAELAAARPIDAMKQLDTAREADALKRNICPTDRSTIEIPPQHKICGGDGTHPPCANDTECQIAFNACVRQYIDDRAILVRYNNWVSQCYSEKAATPPQQPQAPKPITTTPVPATQPGGAQATTPTKPSNLDALIGDAKTRAGKSSADLTEYQKRLRDSETRNKRDADELAEQRRRFDEQQHQQEANKAKVRRQIQQEFECLYRLDRSIPGCEEQPVECTSVPNAYCWR